MCSSKIKTSNRQPDLLHGFCIKPQKWRGSTYVEKQVLDRLRSDGLKG